MTEKYRMIVNSYPTETHPEAPYYWAIKTYDETEGWYILHSGHAKTPSEAVATASGIFLVLAAKESEAT